MSDTQQTVMPSQANHFRRGDMVNAYGKGIPLEVWNYRLGGCQVLKKWLSNRESRAMDRALSVSEVSWFSEIAHRVACIPDVGEGGSCATLISSDF